MYSTPNKSRIRLLVNELRTTTEKQGKHALKSDLGYCCLGIACQVFHRETGLGQWEPMTSANALDVVADKHPETFTSEPDDQHWNSLPESVAAWYGMSENPSLNHHTATYLNDTEEKTFSQIADLFEQTYLRDEAKDG